MSGWRKSTFCNGADACVEVAFVDGLVVLRDAKEADGPVLVFSEAEFAAFVAGVKDGEFDLAALAGDAGDGSDETAYVRVPEAPVAREEAASVSL